jgi:putative tryptophan/tyrosine transport system substrate-binding protein
MKLNLRRLATALIGAILLMSPPAEAQQPPKVPRVGYMALDLAPGSPHLAVTRDAFLQELRDLGYVEGRNLQIEYRDAKANPNRFPALAAELVALNVDVIVAAGGTLAALAAKQATTTIPIVFPVVGDPVADGLVASVRRPGGNVTGVATLLQLVDKLLELLKDANPTASRVALLLKPDAAPERSIKEYRSAAAKAAKALGVQLQIVEARGPEDFERAFADATRARAAALAVLATPLFDTNRPRLVELALRHRLPTVYPFKSWVEAGGLMSYGPDIRDLFRRAAVYVDKILKGAKPADLPVEQPTKFELAINLRTAKALGLTIPQSLLLRADHVIE